jgi:hypothetical protein
LYELVGPDGKEYSFYNAKEFAREHGLSAESIYNLWKGEILNHKGFHLRNPRERKIGPKWSNQNNPKRKYEFIKLEKDGVLHTITDDISEFCKINRLPKREVYALTSQNQISSHGFRLKSFKYSKDYLSKHKGLASGEIFCDRKKILKSLKFEYAILEKNGVRMRFDRSNYNQIIAELKGNFYSLLNNKIEISKGYKLIDVKWSKGQAETN